MGPQWDLPRVEGKCHRSQFQDGPRVPREELCPGQVRHRGGDCETGHQGTSRGCAKWRQEPGDLRDERRPEDENDGAARDREGGRRGGEGEGGGGRSEEEGEAERGEVRRRGRRVI